MHCICIKMIVKSCTCSEYHVRKGVTLRSVSTVLKEHPLLANNENPRLIIRFEGSAVCLTRDRWVAGSSLTGVTALYPWARHFNPSLVLAQPRKTRHYITERSLMGYKESNQTNKQNMFCNYLLAFTLFCS